MAFKKATKEQLYARMALCGPSGSGKTFTALRIAKTICEETEKRTGKPQRFAVFDTERGSARKYVGVSTPENFDFDHDEPDSFAPSKYIQAIDDAEKGGYCVLVIDSLSHAWAGKDGVLEFVDQLTAKSSSHNSFDSWRKASPMHNQLVDRITGAKIHIIATMRTKSEYVMEEKRGRDGKVTRVPRKVGLAPIQRDHIEYEFDITADLDTDHQITFSKSRCNDLDGKSFIKPGPEVAKLYLAWLMDGEPPQPVAAVDHKANLLSAIESAMAAEDIANVPERTRALVAEGKISRDDGMQISTAWRTMMAKLKAPASSPKAIDADKPSVPPPANEAAAQ